METTTMRARRPSANHASCRRATLPPVRPTWRLASVVALRMTRPSMAPRSGQSTFCSSRRSMPPSTVMTASPEDLRGRDLLEEDRVEDLARDRRRDLTALAAALDEHDDHDLGILDRREGGEPGVVLSPVRAGVGDRLRRPRLPGNVETGDAGAGAG